MMNNFCVLGFANFNLLLCLPSFLGAGLGKWTQKPLGAHQERFDHRSEREHGWFRFYRQSCVSCTGNSTYLDPFTINALFIIRVISLLSPLALLWSIRQEESMAKENVTFCLQNEEIMAAHRNHGGIIYPHLLFKHFLIYTEIWQIFYLLDQLKSR